MLDRHFIDDIHAAGFAGEALFLVVKGPSPHNQQQSNQCVVRSISTPVMWKSEGRVTRVQRRVTTNQRMCTIRRPG